MIVYEDPGRCRQEGLERVGAGVCPENETTQQMIWQGTGG
jgi:hypothetical protein